MALWEAPTRRHGRVSMELIVADPGCILPETPTSSRLGSRAAAVGQRKEAERMDERPARSLVVSVHDVCPRFEAAFHRWRSLLDAWGVRKRSIAAVPFYDGDRHLSSSETLAAALAEEVRCGSEVVLHGYTHVHSGGCRSAWERLRDRATTQGCAEFSSASRNDAIERIRRGLAELEPLVPGRIRGFTPPGWWIGRELLPVLVEAGFDFCTGTFRVMDLRRGDVIRAPVVVGLPEAGWVPVLVHGYSFRVLPALLKGRGMLRVALHPYDLDNPLFMRDAERLVRRAVEERDVCVYEELVG